MPIGFIGTPEPQSGVIGPGTIAKCAIGGGTINVGDWINFSVQTTGPGAVELMGATDTFQQAFSTTQGVAVPLGINQVEPSHHLSTIQGAWITLAAGTPCFIRYSFIQGFTTVASIDGPTLTWEPAQFAFPILSKMFDALGGSSSDIAAILAAVSKTFPATH